MVSFWGFKKDDPGSAESPHDDYHDAPGQEYEEPSERTRLLPSEDNRGFLNPDDPAVSPESKETPK